jgi:MFS family permease
MTTRRASSFNNSNNATSTITSNHESQSQQQQQQPLHHSISSRKVDNTTNTAVIRSSGMTIRNISPVKVLPMTTLGGSTTGILSSTNSNTIEKVPSSETVDDTSRTNNDEEYDNSDRYEKEQPLPKNRPSWFIIQVTVIASLGGILFGYDLGIISCTLPQLIIAFNLSNKQQELIVSILYLGGTIGATLGGSICDIFGRKKSILLCDVIFTFGGIILFSAHNVATILIGRIVVGFAIALSGIADVTYLHEIAPTQFRGAIVSVNEACIALGFLLAFGIGTIPSLSYQKSVEEDIDTNRIDGWRIMFGISGVVAILQFIGMIYLPESPKWLSDRGRYEESDVAQHQIQADPVLYQASTKVIATDHQRRNSRTMLMITRGNDHHRHHDVHDANSNIRSSSPVAMPTTNYQAIGSPGASNNTSTENDTISSLTSHHNNQRGHVYRICCYPIYQTIYLCQQFCLFVKTIRTQYSRQTYITFFLATTQQFCGQTNVLSYAPLIFAAASSSSSSSKSDTDDTIQAYATVSIGIVKFIVTALVIWKIESIGRRTLLLFGIGTISFGLFLLAIAFAGTNVVENESNEEQDEVSHVVRNTHSSFYLALPGVLMVVCGYSMSYGPLTWLITSELYPTDIRGRALGISTIVTYACAAIVTYTFLSATAWVGSSVLFSTYLFITCTGLIFAFLAIPDTGGRNPDGIDAALDHMVWWQERQPNFLMKARHTTVSTSDRDVSQFVAETEIT